MLVPRLLSLVRLPKIEVNGTLYQINKYKMTDVSKRKAKEPEEMATALLMLSFCWYK